MAGDKPFSIKGKAALVISECQRGVIEPGMTVFPALAEQVEARGIVVKIAGLAQAFRAAGLSVIHATAAHRPDFIDVKPNTLVDALVRKQRGMVKGTPEVDIVAPLAPEPEDIVSERSSGMIPFLGTPLDAQLRRMDVETVVLAGVSTNLAIAGCTFAATEMGYYVVIAEDCTAGSDPDVHRVILEEQLRLLARIATAEQIASALG